ncbi:MAG: 3-hydroxyacyl-ACP dehydratase FabZ [Wenzhouxiangella sp.]|jgi:3-hydroxyacyl-[acyl-carrier-protein] dehydratase|nr:3-hydroxyacyl-ACP dehydratase FabZ [Wenzhouxiangella sp.]
MTEPQAIDIERILELLPHRYPFLLVDRVLNFELGPPAQIQALKNVTFNEPFFQGHFPGHPVMPGVLIIEAMAQAAGCLAHLARSASTEQRQLFYLVKVDKARFSQTVVPGDQLIFEVEQKRLMRNMGIYEAITRIGGKTVASAELMCAAKPEPTST